MKNKAHIIAIHENNKVSYHYTQSKEDEQALIGKVIGKFETQHYLENEKAIQEEMTRISKKENTK